MTHATAAPAVAPAATLLILGATGLVGSECLRQALADPAWTRVVTLTRRPLRAPDVAAAGARLLSEVDDLANMAAHPASFGVDAIVCALGTTIRQAGSRDAFRRVDYDYPMTAAWLGRSHDVPHFLLVSATGADARSRIFYNRVKGEVEAGIGTLAYPAVTVARPSLLLGERAEFRLGERVAGLFGWLTPRAIKPIPARAVAAALLRAARAPRPGLTVLSNAMLYGS